MNSLCLTANVRDNLLDIRILAGYMKVSSCRLISIFNKNIFVSDCVTLIGRIQKISKLFGVSEDVVIESCLKNVFLLFSEPDTLYKKACLVKKYLGVSFCEIISQKYFLITHSFDIMYLNFMAFDLLGDDYKIGNFSLVIEKYIPMIDSRFDITYDDIYNAINVMKKRDNILK